MVRLLPWGYSHNSINKSKVQNFAEYSVRQLFTCVCVCARLAIVVGCERASTARHVYNGLLLMHVPQKWRKKTAGKTHSTVTLCRAYLLFKTFSTNVTSTNTRSARPKSTKWFSISLKPILFLLYDFEANRTMTVSPWNVRRICNISIPSQTSWRD